MNFELILNFEIRKDESKRTLPGVWDFFSLAHLTCLESTWEAGTQCLCGSHPGLVLHALSPQKTVTANILMELCHFVSLLQLLHSQVH